jgi:hypothetical protein
MAFQKPYEQDVEKEAVNTGSYADEGVVHGETFVQGNTLYAKLQRLAAKFHVEQRGIERVPEDERYDTSLLNVGTMVGRTGVSKTHVINSDYSGFLRIWWCHLLPSDSSRNLFSSSGLRMRASFAYFSTLSAFSPYATSPHSDPDLACGRWFYQDIGSGGME